MVQKAANYNIQYTLLFYLSWICLYLFFPSWIDLHLVFISRGLTVFYPIARTFAVLGLIIYFSISAYLINRYFCTLILDKPIFIKGNEWFEKIKRNKWLVSVCSLSVVLHIYPLSLVFVVMGGGEMSFIHQPLWIYDSLNIYWDSLFDIPVQYLFWSILILMIIIAKQTKVINFIFNYISERFSVYKSNYLAWFFVAGILFAFFSFYSSLFPYYFKDESLHLLRFPPVSKLIYLLNYYAFGFSLVGPRLIQLIFYIMAAVYLYRTILLYREKDIALLGATIYLFSPIVFSYASRAALASGTVFFMILISFYFLRFIKDEDDRDLILTSYFIGIGFLYKRVVLVMFIICFAYLLYSKIKKRDCNSTIYFKILLLSLVPILPWLKIGAQTVYYRTAWANLISVDSIMIYASMVQSQLSWIIFFLFIGAFIYILIADRDDLSLFFGLFFISYFSFFVLQKGNANNHRYLMAFYPAIAVFLALFVGNVTKSIRLKHIFKVVYTVLMIFLIMICLIPRNSSSLVTYKYDDFEGQYYPVDEATDWIKNNTGNKERILSLYLANYNFYLERLYADKERINPGRFLYLNDVMDKELIYPIQNLRKYCNEKNVSYIMFPFGPNNTYYNTGDTIARYLKENKGNEFTEVSKFNFEDNYIFIVKLKEMPD